VSNLNFFGGGGTGVTFYIGAGDAGNATGTNSIGAAGGNVSSIGVGADSSNSATANFSFNPATDFNYVSAGNGGDAVLKGGLGGSVFNVFANAAIGERTGAVFGFGLTGAGGISVGAAGTGTFSGTAGSVVNVTADAIASIIAGHLAAGHGLEQANLANVVTGVILNGAVAPSLTQQFFLTINGDIAGPLATNSQPIAIASALNALPTIISDGGVTVTNGTSGYVVTFNDVGVAPGTTTATTIVGYETAPDMTTETTVGNTVTSTSEVQNVQVPANNSFTITYFEQGFAPETTTVLPAGATNTQVQNALNLLPNVLAINDVTVSTGAGTPNPSYNITFANTAGAQELLVPDLEFTTVATGGTTGTDVQTLTFPNRSDLTPVQLSTANFVGSFQTPLRQQATTFNYAEYTPTSVFVFNDIPLDGLIAATNLTSYKNFVPEAFVTSVNGAAVLVDPTVS
jgi:hypothetical protein